MRLTCEYELDISSIAEVSLAKDHGENDMKLRPLLARHLLQNRLLGSLRVAPFVKDGAARRLSIGLLFLTQGGCEASSGVYATTLPEPDS